MNSRVLLIGVLAVVPAAAQAIVPPSFEAASIKPSAPDAGRPSMISNPGRWSCVNCSLFSILTNAFRAFDWQLDVPEWTYTARFDVIAKLPEDAKPAELPQRLQSLLRDRFKMTSHTENRERPVYELVIANGGPKIRRVTEAAPAQPPGPEIDANGFPNVPNGNGMRFSSGRGRIQFRKQSMQVFANYLSGPAGRPVLDATGLEGDYELTLSFSLPRPSGSGAPTLEETNADLGPTIYQAVEQQLGLKLKPAKRPVAVTVVDHMDRTPIEN